MEAPVPQASRELAGRHCHSMGGGAYYRVDPCVCGDMACHRRIVASGNRLHRGRSHRPGAELRRADGRAGRSRGATGRDAPGGGGSDPTGAAAPGGAGVATGAIGGGQVTMNEALLLAGPSPETGKRTRSRNLNSGNACGWKPWNGAAGPFAVRRWLRPTGNWTAPDHRRTARSPARSKRSAPRERRRSLRPLGRSRV